MIEEKEITKVYYTTQEASVFLTIPIRTIRDWIRRFGIQCPRNPRGVARLNKENLDSLRLIHKLLHEDKYSYAGVKQQLELLKEKK